MLIKDDWLSQYFEGGTFRYTSPFDLKEFPKGFISAKVPVTDINHVNFLYTQGFNLVEVLVQFQQRTPTVIKTNTNIQVGFALSEDKDKVLEIAENSFIFSRFYQDSTIDKNTASRIKRDWVSNYFQGTRGTHMVIARDKNKVIGFMLLINTVIDLIAVSPHHLRKGISSRMISFANQKIGFLKAGTQLINSPSISLYENSGFFLQNAQFVLHKHNGLK